MEFVDLKTQYKNLSQDIHNRIQAVHEHGQYVMGPEVFELEQRLAEYIQSPYCITCSDGTNALLLAMIALDIGPGDEIITTPFTFFATVEMMVLLGAKPVFVDIDLATYNIDPAQIEAAITSRTKAIMAVSLYGQTADFTAIKTIAAKHAIPVVEDAAQSFGAMHHGKSSGALTVIGTTSFFPSKPLGCYGDGGACFTNDKAIAERIAILRNHGQSSRYWHKAIGINSRLDTIQAAVLLAKLDIFSAEIKARHRHAALYDELLGDVVVTPSITPGNLSVYAQYTIRVPQRQTLIDYLTSCDIPTAVHYPLSVTQQPVFADHAFAKLRFKNTEQAAAEVLSLPMHPYLTRDQIVKICDSVHAFHKGNVLA